MPITKTTGYKASDGMVYATVEEAQRAELSLTLSNADPAAGIKIKGDEFAMAVLLVKDKLLDILTTGPRSRPKARKAAGTTAPRRAAKRAAPATPAQAAEGFKTMREAVEDMSIVGSH